MTSTMDEQYEAAASEAHEATKKAGELPTAATHRRAAESHLAASRHAHLVGKGDEAQAHDAKATEHMHAMNACDAGAANVPKVAPLEAKENKPVAKDGKKPLLPVLQARANARMKGDKALMAGIKDAGYSFNDLQQQIRAQLDAVDFGDDDADDNAMGVPSYWVTDVIAPAHEQGETWEAIVGGPCGKLYCVQFTIEGDNVAIVGEPKEVTADTDYEYVKEEAEEVGAMDASQVAALMAANPEGINQYTVGTGKIEEKASKATEKANEASAKANESGSGKDHIAAMKAHIDGREANRQAAARSMQEGQRARAEQYEKQADHHVAQIGHHANEAAKGSANAKSATPSTALQAGKASAAKRFEMASTEAKDCSASIPALHAKAESLHRIAAEHAKMAGVDGKAHSEAADYHATLKAPVVMTSAVASVPADNATANLGKQEVAK